MGIEAENTLAKQDAEERKPMHHEYELAQGYLGKPPYNTGMLAALLAEHRVATKRIVLEEQGIGSSQDLEKRHALSVRVTALEGEKKDLQAENARMVKMLGYKLLEVRVVVEPQKFEVHPDYHRVVEENVMLRSQLARYENIRKTLNEEPSISVSSIDPDGMAGRFKSAGNSSLGTGIGVSQYYAGDSGLKNIK